MARRPPAARSRRAGSSSGGGGPRRPPAEDGRAGVHAKEPPRRAIEAGRILFGGGELRQADAATLATVAAEVRVLPVTRRQLDAGFPLAEALVGAGLASSKADARRGLQGARKSTRRTSSHIP